MGRRRRGGSRTSTSKSNNRSKKVPLARKLLINARESEESRIALLEAGQLEEFYIERESLGSTLGNIYKARISNVEASIGAAFVEFGHDRQGFLHVSDLCMAAVDGDSAVLLAPLQAAREDADDARVARVKAATEDDAEGESEADAEKSEDEDGDEAETAPAEAGKTGDQQEAPEDHPDWDGHDEDEDEDEEELEAPPPAVLALEVHRSEGDQDDADDADDADDDGEPVAEAMDVHAADEDSDSDADDDADSDADDDADSAAAEDAEQADGSDEDDSEDAATEDEQASDGGGRSSRRRGRRGRRRGHSGEGRGTSEEDGDKGRAEASESGRGGAKDGGRSGGRGRGRGKGRDSRRQPRELPPIEQILKKGQEIVVQVIKDGIGNKGPTLTTYLSIPGRFIVLMPGIGKRGVSRKVEDPAERDRLKGLVRDLECPEGLGFIVRTAGTGCSAEDLQRDLDYLLRLWDQMRVRVKEHNPPVLLYQENDLVIRTLRDLYDGDAEIIIDDPATTLKAKEFMEQILPSCVDKVQAYEGDRPLFSHYGIESELAKLLENRIELKSGATLVMEQTEALVAIDVNSSRFKGTNGKPMADTAFTVNMEAAEAIARQIRLRDLGGVVVVDFIDMRLEKHRKEIERSFKEHLRRDRARIKVAHFSPFGILELTRQRVRPSLKRSVHQECPYCQSTGFIPSDETSCLTVVRMIRDNLWRPGKVLVVTVRPEVAEAVLNQQRGVIAEMERESGKTVFVRADHRKSYEDVEVRAMVTLPGDMDHRRA